jgi:phage recombination protein Bet
MKKEIENRQEELDIVSVLERSVYPGASRESISMALSYCRSAGLDPLLKPVHIVPIWDSKSRTMRDVIMPGIGLYRIQAARTGEYAGISEPEFGKDIYTQLGGQEITYPEWCKVTVSRLLKDGKIAQFTAVERWIECYAVRGGQDKSTAPNAIWAKRPYGQLAKCAEAQALRKGFPELGSVPTAEEMEGKGFDVPQDVPRETVEHTLEFCTDERFVKNAAAWKELIESGKKSPEEIITTVQTKYLLTEEQKTAIMDWKHEQNN